MRLDHGLDRLRFFFVELPMNVWKTGLAAGIFFSFPVAFATTFGPIPVIKQAENTQYYVHARVIANGKALMEPRLGRPYTYWDMQVTEQFQGAPLPSPLTVREPGGEIGESGYHVAGSAEFSAGEDVFVALRDTDQGDVKEVVGLASGKFSVERGKDGKPAVLSGLGVFVSGPNAETLSPEEFGSLLHRIAQGQATDADRNIFVSRKPLHDDDIPSLAASSHPLAALSSVSPTVAEPAAASAQPAVGKANGPGPNALQQSSATTDEKSTGSSFGGWLIAAGALVGLILGLVLLLR